MDRLSHTLARLEMDCMGTSDFTNLIDTEIRRSMPPARDFNPRRVLQKQSRKMLPARDLNNTRETSDSFRECSWRRSSAHTTLSVVEGTVRCSLLGNKNGSVKHNIGWIRFRFQRADREGEHPASLRQAHIYGWRPAASQNWKNLVKMGGQCVVRQLSMI